MNHSEAQRRCTNDTQMIRPAEQQQSFHSKPPGSLPSCPRQRSVHVAASREMGEMPGPISASSHPKMCVLDVRCHDISRTRRGNELRVLGLALGLLLVGLPRSAAILTGTAPANGPRTGGVTMTIRGAGFGPGLSLPEVRLGSSVCTNTRWISDSIIITRIPSSGVQFQDNVILTMQTNAQHTLSDAFTFDQPVILGAGPANSPANANGVVTFRGMNFGAYDHSPRGRVGNTACVTTQWTSQSSIECKIPFGAHSLYLLHTASLAPPPSFLSSLLPCSSKHTSSPQAILCVLLARFFHPAYSFSISFSVLLLLPLCFCGRYCFGQGQVSIIAIDGCSINFISEDFHNHDSVHLRCAPRAGVEGRLRHKGQRPRNRWQYHHGHRSQLRHRRCLSQHLHWRHQVFGPHLDLRHFNRNDCSSWSAS